MLQQDSGLKTTLRRTWSNADGLTSLRVVSLVTNVAEWSASSQHKDSSSSVQVVMQSASRMQQLLQDFMSWALRSLKAVRGNSASWVYLSQVVYPRVFAIQIKCSP